MRRRREFPKTLYPDSSSPPPLPSPIPPAHPHRAAWWPHYPAPAAPPTTPEFPLWPPLPTAPGPSPAPHTLPALAQHTPPSPMTPPGGLPHIALYPSSFKPATGTRKPSWPSCQFPSLVLRNVHSPLPSLLTPPDSPSGSILSTSSPTPPFLPHLPPMDAQFCPQPPPQRPRQHPPPCTNRPHSRLGRRLRRS